MHGPPKYVTPDWGAAKSSVEPNVVVTRPVSLKRYACILLDRIQTSDVSPPELVNLSPAAFAQRAFPRMRGVPMSS